MVENEYEKNDSDEAEREVAPEQPAPESQEPEAEPEPEVAAGEALSQALKVSFTFLKLAMIFLLGVWLVSGIFSVRAHQMMFKLRFGTVVRSKGEFVLRPGSGLHIRWPWEEKVPVIASEQTLALDSEFWTEWLDTPGARKESLDVREDGFLITGDKNIVHMKLLARYQVRSDATGALAYAFGVKDPEMVLKRALMAATTKVVGSMGVMDVINRRGLFGAIEEDLRARLDQFEQNAGIPLGVKIIRVEPVEMEKVKNPTEPFRVSQAFYDAQNASSMKKLLEEEGRTEAARGINEAQSQAAAIRATAHADAVRRVRSARADARTMEKLLPIYNQSPEVANILRDRFYQRMMEMIMSRSPGAFVLYEPSDPTQRELRLILGRKPLPKTAEEESRLYP